MPLSYTFVEGQYHLYIFIITDIDECGANTDYSHPKAQCDDVDGYYTCTCDNGYTGNGLVCEGRYNDVG